jgi:hypothetical protein
MVSILHARIMTFQAGAEAAKEITAATDLGDGDDRRQIAQMAEKLGCDDAGEQRLRRFTRHLVRRHRPTIERVAHALRKRRTLTERQIDRLVWPRAAMRGFITYPQLRTRLGIGDTLDKVIADKMRDGDTLDQAIADLMRDGLLPRVRLFNGRLLWQVREVENWLEDDL